MKVLFVCSGNRVEVSPIIRNQGDSICAQGVDIAYYTIKGKGIGGYLKNVRPIRRYLKQNQFDVVHAHYSLSAFVASLAGAKPLVVSLMGSDVKASGIYKMMIRVFAFLFSWKSIIVKSADMYQSLGIRRAVVIPNGVNMDRFKPLDLKECQETLGWSSEKKHVLFTSDPKRREKNYALAESAVSCIENAELHAMVGVQNEDTPIWYNAADVVLMTSLWEGSPNAIKEAMACSRPIVSVNVGDVKKILGTTEHCYMVQYSQDQVVSKLQLAMQHNGATEGRKCIVNLGLDTGTVAKQIIAIYDNLANGKK